VIQTTKMVPNGRKIGKEQLNILAYADYNVLIGKNETNKKTFCRNGKHCQNVRTTDKPRKDKIYDTGKENSLKQNKIGHLKIKITNLKEMKISNI